MTQVTPANISRPFGEIPPALLSQTDQFPELENFNGWKGVHMRVLMANIEGGFYVVKIRFEQGTQIATHAHTGSVFAHTLSGEWSYLEYEGRTEPCRTGDFLYEPPGSHHTLKVSDDAGDTEVFFIIQGAMLITENGNVTAVLDAQWHLDVYRRGLEAAGIPVPPVLLGGNCSYLTD